MPTSREHVYALLGSLFPHGFLGGALSILVGLLGISGCAAPPLRPVQPGSTSGVPATTANVQTEAPAGTSSNTPTSKITSTAAAMPAVAKVGLVIGPQIESLPPGLPEVPVGLNIVPPDVAAVPEQVQVPDSRQLLRFPMDAASQPSDVQLASSRELISLTARDAPLNKVLALIAEQHGLNVVTGADVNEQISVNLTETRLEDALDAILTTNGYAWTRQKNIVIVSKVASENKPSATTQGRAVRVFNLNYLSATDVDKVVQGLLSPVGQSFTTESMPTDHRRSHEQLVVEDLPEYLQRIEEYLMQADSAPLQVMIEAHVLQVTLKDNCRHGVNLENILHIANTDVTLSTLGLASGVPPTSSLKIKGTDLDNILNCIKSTTDAKTLASPKVAVLNNQEASMQVGSKIGYLLTTTTQTSTLQSVNFLDVGVILKVLPTITDDGQILINVKPQVSTGGINPTTQLPESDTTEVATSVLLADGEAIVIGGLIKETNNDNQNKIPILGDLWIVGWLFQRSEVIRERNEIIITLLPRIIPDTRGCRSLDPCQVQQSLTPLLYGPLESVDRTQFEPKLPSCTIRPRHHQSYQPPRTNPEPAILAPIEAAPRSPEIYLTPVPQSLDDLIKPQKTMAPTNFQSQAENP